MALNEAEPLNPQLLAYLNRLSDHLFVAARSSRRAKAATCCGSPARRGTRAETGDFMAVIALAGAAMAT